MRVSSRVGAKKFPEVNDTRDAASVGWASHTCGTRIKSYDVKKVLKRTYFVGMLDRFRYIEDYEFERTVSWILQ